MRYLPHTPEDISSMLAVIGVKSVNDLFAQMKQRSCRSFYIMHLPAARSKGWMRFSPPGIYALSGRKEVTK